MYILPNIKNSYYQIVISSVKKYNNNNERNSYFI